MSAFTLAPEEIEIVETDQALTRYQFGTKVAHHYFCIICGIYPFHQTLRKPGHYRVNLGCIDGIDTNAIEVDVFDGASI